MIKSAVTISLVPEALGGPFVFWDDMEAACRRAAELGFDGVEVFAPDARVIRSGTLRTLLNDFGLKLAAVGTGGGWVKHKLKLTGPDPAARRRAVDFVRSFIDAAGELGAPAIIGSMGKWGEDVAPEVHIGQLVNALGDLAAATDERTGLLYEPLNRYENKVLTTLKEAVIVTDSRQRVRLLADLFHMNIEEADIGGAIRAAGSHVGHVHFADSNRHAAGFGHTDFSAIAEALRGVGYAGYVSAEVLPLPDSDAAARQTIESFRKFFR